ncbi:hypothetical protein [Variovorax sp. UC122_21]|uniref:hypothetical protein n=1 Tax=Variovorax sp. UC122_21 TaxID=3374554 RepID=UPI0037572E80
MPKYFIKMGQGIVVDKGVDVIVLTDMLDTCRFIAGLNLNTGKVGAFHYPAGVLINEGTYEGKPLKPAKAFQKYSMSSDLEDWMTALRPSRVQVAFGPGCLVPHFDRSSTDFKWVDHRCELDDKVVNDWIFERCRVKPTRKLCSNPAMVRRVHGDGGGFFHNGFDIVVERVWPHHANLRQIELGRAGAGGYDGYSVFGRAR